MHDHPPGAGRSSFDLIDTEKLFSTIRPGKNITFIDLGCGRGNYAIALSDYVGEQGKIYAFDLWEEGIEDLKKAIEDKKIKNIVAATADVNQKIPLDDDCGDLCLLATVFHDLVHDNSHEGTLQEIRRILKPEGKLAVIEFAKIEGTPGPPIHIRLSPEELDKMLYLYGFHASSLTEIGPYNYLSIFICPKDK
ncbi:class I SAM-dependent methyltransferase [Thermodesulfobacteriota bacterium]